MAESNMTKRALASAMKQLMARHPFAKINVGDICDLCGMNRKSFYYHFRDKYDLVNWIFQTEFISLFQDTTARDYWQIMELLCSYLYENRAFYRNALSIQGQNAFSEYFQTCITPIIRAALQSSMSANDSDSQFVADFFSDALIASIVRWLSSRDIPEPQVYTRQLRLCFVSIIP